MTLTHEPHTAAWDTDLSLGNLRSGLSAFPTCLLYTSPSPRD